MKKKSTSTRKKATSAADGQALRDNLLKLLSGGSAHLTFEEAIAGLPADSRGVIPHGLPFSAWRLLEHLRIAQWDIVEFSVNSRHVSPEWPSGYWPESDAPPSDAAWKKSLRQVRHDSKRMQTMVADTRTDLLAPIPHGEGKTLLREA